MKCDVTIAAYNAEHELHRTVECVLRAIPARVLGKIVIVNNNSTDGTARVIKELQKEHPARIKAVMHAGMLGSVRYRQAQECSTEYIIYVDSNVLLHPTWWRVVRQHIADDVGWIFGHTRTVYPQPYHDFFEWTIKKFGGVGFGDTLVRRDIILACPEMNLIHLGEDNYVHDACKKRGVRRVFIPTQIADHGVIGRHGLFLRHVRAGQSYSIKNGMARSITRCIRFAAGDCLNVIRYARESRCSMHTALVLANELILLRWAFLEGILRLRKLVRDPDAKRQRR